MITDLKAGIVSILTPSGETVGTGFIATPDGLIITCAHVVYDAGAQSDDIIDLVFLVTQEKRKARVVPDYFLAPKAEDVAILRLEGALPKETAPLPLGSSFNTEGRAFSTFGFPVSNPKDGLLGEAKVLGFTHEGNFSLLQLSSNQISEGFSGAPVWDATRHVVIGMITSVVGTRSIKLADKIIQLPFDPSQRQMETAFATPVETICTISPLLHLQVSEVCPYQGLDVFTEAHAKFFFGREHFVDKLLNRLKHGTRFLAIFGPAGSGKSSIIQAGLIPQLRQGAIGDSDRWGILVTRLADDSFRQSAIQGLAIESQDLTRSVETWFMQHPQHIRLVIIIDQFEELLIEWSEVLRRGFLMQLAHLLSSPLLITVVLVTRDDFYNQFVQQEILAEWLEGSLGPLNVPRTLKRTEVVAIVQKPAEAAGLRFEDGLVETIVQDSLDVSHLTNKEQVVQSTILPLIEFTLTLLWEQREKWMLTRKSYHNIGGLTGGLPQWADRVFYGLENQEKQRLARRILTTLIHIGDESQGLPDSRRRLPLASLCHNEREMEEVQQVIQYLVSNRLLVTTHDAQSKQEMVEIIHDALLGEWKQLRRWLEEDRNFLVWRWKLERRVQAWIKTNADNPTKRDQYKLFAGSDLTETLMWLNERSDELSPVELDFIQTSRERLRFLRLCKFLWGKRSLVWGNIILGIVVSGFAAWLFTPESTDFKKLPIGWLFQNPLIILFIGLIIISITFIAYIGSLFPMDISEQISPSSAAIPLTQTLPPSTDIQNYQEKLAIPATPSIKPAEQTIKDTVEKRQDVFKNETFIYGQVQGLVQGENNTVTLIFQNSKAHTMPFLAPPQPPYNLVGRDELLRELKQQLFQGSNLALFALNGLPGVGKTALALAIAHDREVLGHFCDGVLWAGLGRESNVFSYLGTWGMALGIPQSEMEKLMSLTMMTQTVHRAIGTRRMLLVVDDAWSTEAALIFKLGGPNCAHLVTTRFPEVAEAFAGNRTIAVRELGEDDGLTLLERLAPELTKIASDEIRELVHAVGGLPLPLTLMGNYLRIQMRTGQPRRLRTALDRLQQVKERLELSQPQVGLEHHPSLPDGIPLSQLAVIKISDEALDEESRQTLRTLSVFPSKPNSFSEEAALAVAAMSTKAIDTLEDFGLLESSGPSRYTLHQTISDYAKIELDDTTVYERMVEFFIKYVEEHKTDNQFLEREVSNILAAVEFMLERGMHPAGASVFAHFIRILRRTRAN